jgi:hypothetical protein
MHRILVEQARSKGVRHSGRRQGLNIDHVALASPNSDDQLLAMNDALEKMAAQDPTAAKLVKLRHFAGLTVEEAGGLLDLSPRTAQCYWANVRTWLYCETSVRHH